MLQVVENENENNENGGTDELWVENKNDGELWFAISVALMSFVSRTRTIVSFGLRSRRCFKWRDLASAGVRQDRCDLGLQAVVRSTLQLLVRSPLSLSVQVG